MVYWNPVATCPEEAGVDLQARLLAASHLWGKGVCVNGLQTREKTGEVACVAHSLTWYLANLLANSFSPLSTPVY